MKKRILSVMMVLAMLVALLPNAALAAISPDGRSVATPVDRGPVRPERTVPTERPRPAHTTADSEEGPVASENINGRDYFNHAETVKSYLFENESGGLTRVEYVPTYGIVKDEYDRWVEVMTDDCITVEDYGEDLSLKASRDIEKELDIWGGFFAGENYNFFVFGSENPEEDNNAEVIRVVKYSKDWERLGDARLYGANTCIPFDAGSLRCAEAGGMLYIRTCHEMYASKNDGLNHQANVTIAVRESDMTVTDSHYEVKWSAAGYVSHSFNQFIIVDSENRIVSVDHGDAYPRSIDLMVWNSPAGSETLTGGVSEHTVQPFLGEIGNNTTGAAVGGLADTRSGYVVAYNYAEGFDGPWNDEAASNAHRRVYLAYVDKTSGAVSTKAISEPGTAVPMLVPTGPDGGYIFWNGSSRSSWSGSVVDDTLYYARYSADGSVGEVKTLTGSLSDCEPIVYKDRIVWYTTDESQPVFYIFCGDEMVEVEANGTMPAPDAGLFDVDTSNETYDGTPKTKEIKTELVEGSDYTAEYSDNTNAGTATVAITMPWPYIGELTYNFTIDKAERAITLAEADGKSVIHVNGVPGAVEVTEDNAAEEAPVYNYSGSDESVAEVAEDGTVTPVGVGEVTVTVSSPETDNYTAGESSLTIEVDELPYQDLAFAEPEVTEATYGDEPFVIEAVNGTEGGGSITYGSSDGTVAAIDETTGEVTVVGTGSTVITATAEYVEDTYGRTTVSLELEVLPKTLRITDVTVEDKSYDGTADAAVLGVEFEGVVDGDELVRDEDYTVSAEFEDANAAEGKTVNVSVEMLNGNYALESDGFEAEADISRAEAFALVTDVKLAIQEGYTRTAELGSVEGLPADMGGEPVYSVDESAEYTGLASVSLDGTVLMVESNGLAEDKSSETVTVNITGMGNYEDSTITVTVTHSVKVPVSIEGVSLEDRPYSGLAVSYEGSPVVIEEADGSEVDVTDGELLFRWLEYRGGTAYDIEDNAAPVNAGEYGLEISLSEDSYYTGSVTLRFAVTPAEVTVAPEDVSIYVGDKLPEEFEIKYTGLVNGETAEALGMSGESGFVLMDGEEELADSSESGTYTIAWRDPEAVSFDTENYAVTLENGALTVRVRPAPPTGGGGGIGGGSGGGAGGSGGGAGGSGGSAPVPVIPPVWFNPYTDVSESSWYYDAVEYVTDAGYMNGVTEDSFSPNGVTTRAMVVAILYRMEGSPAASGPAFSDVAPGSWYYAAVMWAASEGIVTGYGDGTFGPDRVITREQLAVVLYRYAALKAADVGASANLAAYADAGAVSPWAADALRWANAEGIVTGISDTVLSPGGSATRAQLATVIMRFCTGVMAE